MVLSENNSDPNSHGSFLWRLVVTPVSNELLPSPMWKVSYCVNAGIDRKQPSLLSWSCCLTLCPSSMCMHRRGWIIDTIGFVHFPALGNNQNTFTLVPNNKPRNPELDTEDWKCLSCITNSNALPPWSVVSKQWLPHCLQGTAWPQFRCLLIKHHRN